MAELAEKVYSAMLPRCPENDDYPEYVAFGNLASEYHYSDGSDAGGVLLLPRYLWEVAGAPEHLFIAFSNDQFIPVKDDGRPFAEQLA